MSFFLRMSPTRAAQSTAHQYIRCLSTTGPSFHNSGSDAPVWPTKPNPSPYEIFNLSPDSVYDKRLFAALVKLYHPDRRHHTESTIDGSTRLDRYRLVVLANELLSNPAKRRAYDTYGLGWVTPGAAHSGGPAAPANAHEAARQADRRWHSSNGNSAWRNATWEDWEAWHEQQAGSTSAGGMKQKPVYMSNGAFATLVVVLIGMAATMHYSHMESQSASLLHSRQKENQRIMTMLASRERAAADMSREERLLSFIESAGYEMKFEEKDNCMH
ncbi:J domain-containing protein 1 [Ceratocystis fimbriata CBS 114723]|uniref:J domain-containing protein 1 n=1 Tax=Ceratocystis fimbriata CBS 114723 TaxID=1035309 RepID=A0A2C5X1B9_9PEZI|nr:J domain-containing protein 1 [Ceratocystis fimbriata CBS 114723]